LIIVILYVIKRLRIQSYAETNSYGIGTYEAMDYFISITKQHDVTILSCHFENQLSDRGQNVHPNLLWDLNRHYSGGAYVYEHNNDRLRGVGIKCIDATVSVSKSGPFVIEDNCVLGTGRQNKFKGLRRGVLEIWNSSFTTSFNSKITESLFENNVIGIDEEFTSKTTISENEFLTTMNILSDKIAWVERNNVSAIRIFKCKDFLIRDNIINNLQQDPYAIEDFNYNGILLIENNLNPNGKVYRNTLNYEILLPLGCINVEFVGINFQGRNNITVTCNEMDIDPINDGGCSNTYLTDWKVTIYHPSDGSINLEAYFVNVIPEGFGDGNKFTQYQWVEYSSEVNHLVIEQVDYPIGYNFIINAYVNEPTDAPYVLSVDPSLPQPTVLLHSQIVDCEYDYPCVEAPPVSQVKSDEEKEVEKEKVYTNSNPYPNPTHNYLNININCEENENECDKAYIIISNLSGIEVYSSVEQISNNKLLLNIELLNKGYYTYNVVLKNGTTIKGKFLKK
jgi:hypothetical protein